MATESPSYQPKNAVQSAGKAALITGGAGLAMSSVQNSLAKTNVGALGVFTRTGSKIATFAAMGGIYEFTRLASANLREKDDVYNTSIGAFLGGAVLGIRYRSMPAVIGLGACASIVVSAFEYTGGSLAGSTKNPEVDDFERKEELRKNKRRPIQETIDELGEGRGIYGPGYAERRRERIKQAYGIEVPSS